MLFEIPHVGEILFEEFLKPFNLSQNRLAQAVGVPSNRINAIVKGQRGITADTDLRLTRYFGLSQGYFMRIQDNLELTKVKREIKEDLERIVPMERTG